MTVDLDQQVHAEAREKGESKGNLDYKDPLDLEVLKFVQ